jgi:hypothetical protein
MRLFLSVTDGQLQFELVDVRTIGHINFANKMLSIQEEEDQEVVQQEMRWKHIPTKPMTVSYSHYCTVPPSLNEGEACCLGVDEAGRGSNQ